MRDPSQWPIEVEWPFRKRVLFALGAWLLVMFPAILVTLIVGVLYSLIR